MHVISDTLAMIGLGSQRQLIEGQIETVKQIISGKQIASEEQLLSMAAELLQVEQALDQMQKRQAPGSDEPRSESDVSKDFELDNVLTAVVTAALDDIQKTKSAILDFIKDPSHGDNIQLCIALMQESRGALELLNQPRAVVVVNGLLAYLKGYDIVEFMESDRLDALSQVVVSLEYYLEALGEHRSDADSILDFADVQLQELLSNVKIISPAEDNEELVIVDEESDSTPDISEAQDSEHSDEDVIESLAADESVGQPEKPAVVESEDSSEAIVAAEISIEEKAESPVPAEPAQLDEEPELAEVEQAEPVESAPQEQLPVAAAPASAEDLIKVVPVVEELEVLKPGSDPEILEIYLEEADEESQNIKRLQQDWMLHPEDENAVKNIRRAFHTIKGSGRLVGAMKIGEFAWDFEQLLNRVLDKTVATSPRVIKAVGEAAVALPQLVEELKTGKTPEYEINYLRGLARALAEFKADQVLSDHTRQMSAIESPYDRITGDGEDDSEAEADEESEPEAIFDTVEPDTMQVDPAQLQQFKIEEADEEINHSDENRFDETVLAAPPEVIDLEVDDDEEEVIEIVEMPGDDFSADFTQAIDYSQTPAGQAQQQDDDNNGFDEEIELVELGQIEDEIVDEIDFDVPQLDDPESLELEAEEINLESGPDDELSIEPADDVQQLDEPEEIDLSALPEDDLETQADADDQQQTDAGDADNTGVPPDPFVDTTSEQQLTHTAAEASEPSPPDQDQPTGLSFDPDLLIIYQQEVEQHLSTVSTALDRAEKIQELVPGEAIYRALHTIHGASRTADISSIGELASLLEKPLKAAIAQNLALDLEIVALYREGQRALQSMTRSLVETRELPVIPADLEISLRALAEDFEEHTVELPEDEEGAGGNFVDTLTMMNESEDSEQDNELLTIFIDEANELLEMSDHTLHDWMRQQGDDMAAMDYTAVMELQRYLHTLKGGARMAELKQISDLSHEMESMFIAVIDGRVEKNEDLTDLLRDCFDLLHKQVLEAQQGRPLSDSEEHVELLKNLRRGIGAERSEEPLDEGMDVDSEAIDIVSENLPSEPLSPNERASQDVIKVRSDLLDNLVNSAGEVSIYRARMEQQVAGLGSYLGELGQTISRLKSQLRNLEAETDAQIHFSHRSEASQKDHFDPLEMDRYTLIQELSKSLSESVNDLSSLQGMLGEQVKDSETLLLQQSRVNTDLQDGLIKSRMVKFSGLLSRLRRLVRQSSQELGKKAELKITGEENEVDNKVLDRMVAPLEHIIRNALSHGIETPVERVKKGKPESGSISIDISRDGSDIVIRVSDDGAGVNLEKVRGRALQLGLIEESQQVPDIDLVQYILEPGFSTAEHVTQMSGRGVGMDVVDIEIKQLGGTLQIETTPQGSSFVARLPFTLSINQAILVRTGDETYAIPLINIEGITRLDNREIVEQYRQEDPELEYAGQRFALRYLSRLVGLSAQFKAGEENDKQPIILTRSGDIRVALHVDEIIGNREIVVKTLGKQLSQVKGLSGASILADGSVVLILDVNGLIRHSSTSAVKIVYHQDNETVAAVRSLVMVVDDSITMRRVASKLLERHNFEVITAKDGVDALAQLQDVRPDVMLLDIEMPRMDGFELATHMQNEASYSRIPIIMITSRTGEKHRDRAFEIGVANYMGKPYQEEELIENIQNALAVGQ